MNDLPHPAALAQPLEFEPALGLPRSPQWPSVRAAHLRENPNCAACGACDGVAVHHKKPFHKFPELELAPSNLLTLCQNEDRQCHFWLGHCFYWMGWNSHVTYDAERFRARVRESRHNADKD